LVPFPSPNHVAAPGEFRRWSLALVPDSCLALLCHFVQSKSPCHTFMRCPALKLNGHLFFSFCCQLTLSISLFTSTFFRWGLTVLPRLAPNSWALFLPRNWDYRHPSWPPRPCGCASLTQAVALSSALLGGAQPCFLSPNSV
jgi:hypothetical protein